MKRLVLLLLILLAVPASAAPRPGYGWPLSGTPTVTRGFEPPTTAYGAGHRGVDLLGTLGEAVLAAGPGRVTYAGLLAGRGVVTVTHAGGLRTTYEPVRASVTVGTEVARGDVLGHLTSGHASCRIGTVCLHWGLLRGDTYLDPLSLIMATPVRLLPVGPSTPPLAAVVAGPSTHPTGSSLAGRSLTGRSLGAAGALGSLALGVRVLASRRRPAPPPPPIDLRRERARRRAA